MSTAGETPPCAVCGHRGRRRRRVVHLTHGISVWLCDVHASQDYLARRGGECFTARLREAWVATGALTRRRAAALRAHVARQRVQDDVWRRPGSYSWPRLRAEAERRFAEGDDPRGVIEELRERHENDSARPPSVRTMRRWYTEARWRSAAPAPPRDPGERPQTVVVAEYMLPPPFMHRHFPQERPSARRRGP